jgi:hypothetical protein
MASLLTGQGDLKEMFGQVQKKIDASSDDRAKEYLVCAISCLEPVTQATCPCHALQVNLNNIETSQQYLAKLHDTISHEFDKVFEPQPERYVNTSCVYVCACNNSIHDHINPQREAKGGELPSRYAQHGQGVPPDTGGMWLAQCSSPCHCLLTPIALLAGGYREDVFPPTVYIDLQLRRPNAGCTVCWPSP